MYSLSVFDIAIKVNRVWPHIDINKILPSLQQQDYIVHRDCIFRVYATQHKSIATIKCHFHTHLYTWLAIVVYDRQDWRRFGLKHQVLTIYILISTCIQPFKWGFSTKRENGVESFRKRDARNSQIKVINSTLQIKQNKMNI